MSELSETAARDMKTPEDQVPPLEAPSNHEWDRLINGTDNQDGEEGPCGGLYSQ